MNKAFDLAQKVLDSNNYLTKYFQQLNHDDIELVISIYKESFQNFIIDEDIDSEEMEERLDDIISILMYYRIINYVGYRFKILKEENNLLSMVDTDITYIYDIEDKLLLLTNVFENYWDKEIDYDGR